LVAQAQNNDAALWTNIYLEKKMTKKFNSHLNLLSRFTENYSQLGYAYADLGVTYKVAKFMNVTFDYVYIKKRKLDGFYSTRNQFYFNLLFKYNIRRCRISYRTMIQTQYKDITTGGKNDVLTYIFRNKITARYEISKYFTPYIAHEFYYQFNRNSENYFYRSRSFIGVFYTFSKNSNIELYYVFQKGFNVKSPENVYALGIGYSHLFK
jgi:hypothetical protein